MASCPEWVANSVHAIENAVNVRPLPDSPWFGHGISHQPTPPTLTALYEEYEWRADRDVADVRTALAETEVAVGVELEPGDGSDETTSRDTELVAAARVLTDYTYYATVYDVIVAADRRGEGLGDRLVTAVVDHPDLQDVVGLSLLCRRGLVPYYESVGFECFDPEMKIPEGGTEELVRMTYDQTD